MPLRNDVRHYEVFGGALIAEIEWEAARAGVTPDKFVEGMLEGLRATEMLKPERFGMFMLDFEGRR